MVINLFLVDIETSFDFISGNRPIMGSCPKFRRRQISDSYPPLRLIRAPQKNEFIHNLEIFTVKTERVQTFVFGCNHDFGLRQVEIEADFFSLWARTLLKRDLRFSSFSPKPRYIVCRQSLPRFCFRRQVMHVVLSSLRSVSDLPRMGSLFFRHVANFSVDSTGTPIVFGILAVFQ